MEGMKGRRNSAKMDEKVRAEEGTNGDMAKGMRQEAVKDTQGIRKKRRDRTVIILAAFPPSLLSL